MSQTAPRTVLVVAIVAGVAFAFAYAGGWLSPRSLTPARMIDTFEAVNGAHPGFRRNHAKGVGVRGVFEPNGAGVALSRSAVFAVGRIPVIGRFALGGGQPYATDAPHTVRSMALLFQIPGGEEWRTGMNNIPVFPVRSAEAFHDLLVASAPDAATGKPDSARMAAFFSHFPESQRAMGLIKASAVSSGFENSTYNSLNAFRMIDGSGHGTPVRWCMVPDEPFAPVVEGAPEGSGPNTLFDHVLTRLAEGPLRWHLVVTVGEAGDATADATVPWPEERKRLDVGTLTIDRAESEETSPARDLNFDPLILPDGIAGSDDPLLSARSAAYSQSFTRREGEAKTPSAVTPAAVAAGGAK